MDAQQSIYQTTTNTYNALNQSVRVREYQGGETSTTFQDTLRSYDGYGRLASAQAPSQTSPTQYAYNADDTLHLVTDGRGATTTFNSYNGRKQATSVTYALAGLD